MSELYQTQLAVCVVSTDGSRWDNNNDFKRTILRFPLRQTDDPYRHYFIMCTFNNSGEHESIENLRRVNMFVSHTLSICKSLPLWSRFLALNHVSPLARRDVSWRRCVAWAFLCHIPERSSPLVLAVQDLDEGLPELHVESGVYDGIHSTVHVAQPSEGIVHLSRYLAFSAMSV